MLKLRKTATLNEVICSSCEAGAASNPGYIVCVASLSSRFNPAGLENFQILTYSLVG